LEDINTENGLLIELLSKEFPKFFKQLTGVVASTVIATSWLDKKGKIRERKKLDPLFRDSDQAKEGFEVNIPDPEHPGQWKRVAVRW